MDDQNFKNYPPNKIWFSLNFLFLFYNVYKEKMITIIIEDGDEKA